MEDEIVNEDLAIMKERTVPSNALDSNIFLKPVKDLKLPAPVTLEIDETLEEVLKFMQLKQFGCIMATKGNVLAGIVTERDIITKAIGNDEYLSMKVQDVMTPNPETFQENDEIAYVIKAMSVGGYRHVPIVNERNEPVGLVSVKDIVRFIVQHFPKEIMNLPPTPVRTASEPDGG